MTGYRLDATHLAWRTTPVPDVWTIAPGGSSCQRLLILERLVFARLFGRRRDPRPAHDAFSAIVAQSRQEGFYSDWGVPDTLDGRFDMVALHVFLLMHRLKGQGTEAEGFSRRLFEVMMADMDQSLRELGVGDTGVAKRVKRMLRGMAGRIQAYDQALEGAGNDALEVVVDNNLYGTVNDSDPAAVTAMAVYVRAQSDHLAGQPLEHILKGRIGFQAVPCRL